MRPRPPIAAHGRAEEYSLVSPAGLRTAEKLALTFFGYLAVAAFIHRVPLPQRLAVVGLNLLAGVILIGFGRTGLGKRNSFLRATRDWLPCVLILLAYRESGLYFTPDPLHRLDYLLERWDAALLSSRWVVGALSIGAPWLQRYLEFCYFLCYPLVPLGLGCLQAARRFGRLAEAEADRAVDRFWTAVLLALFFCFLIFPLFPLTPPRILFHDFPGPTAAPLFRRMNSWLLDQYSVQACIFPSGHVAGVTAMALAVRPYLPRAGSVLVVAAASVAAATVVGRYHYAVDALAGALVGLAASLLSARLHRS